MRQTVDKQLVRDRFRRRLRSYDRHSEVQTATAHRLLDELVRLRGQRFARVLEIGCGSGTLTRLIARALDVREFHANDIVDDCRFPAEKATRGVLESYRFIGGDIEGELPLPSDLDAILSNAVFQWLEDLDALVPRMATVLGVNGVLAFSTFGPDNLREIRAITGTGLAYRSAADIARLLERDFRVLHRGEETRTLRFASPLDVLRHVRGMGANALTRSRWQRSAVERFVASYRERWTDGESVLLTYHPMIFVAEKR